LNDREKRKECVKKKRSFSLSFVHAERRKTSGLFSDMRPSVAIFSNSDFILSEKNNVKEIKISLSKI
jgi:hypothetical protein